MSDPQQIIPTFDQVMQKDTQNGKIPSFDDIMGGEPPVKKKVGLGVIGEAAKTGGQAGTSVPQSEEKQIGDLLSKVKHSPGTPTTTPEKPEIEIDGNDPLGSIDRGLLSKTVRFGGGGDMQKAKLLPQNQKSLDDNKEHKLLPHQAKQVMDEVVQNAFPTTQDAQNWLVNHSEKNNGEILPTNQTANLAKKMVEDKQAVIGVLNKNDGDISKSAVEYFGSKDDITGEKIRAMNGNIPRAMQGNLEWDFLQSKPMKEWANESQENHNHYKEREFNFYNNYPELHTQSILQKIAQGREDYGKNNPFLNLVGVNSSDEMVDNLVMRGELTRFDKEFYEKNIRPVLKLHGYKIPTPGVLERAFESTTNAIQDIPKSVYDLTGIHEAITSREDDAYNQAKQDYESVQPKYKGINRVSSEIGNLTGIVIPVTGGVKLLQGFNIIRDANMANQVSMAATFYHGLYEENKREMSPDKARMAALLQTLVYANIAKTLPQVGRQVANDIKPSVKNILADLADDKITGQAAAMQIAETAVGRGKQVAGTLGKTAVGTFKMATEMGLATAINGQITGAFSGRFDADQNLKNTLLTVESMLLGGGPLAYLGARGGNRKANGATLNKIAEQPDFYESHLKQIAEQDPDFAKKLPEYLSNLQHLKSVHEELKGRDDLSQPQKEAFQLLSLNQKIIESKIKASPDKALTGKDEKQIAEIEIEKQKVLDPEMGNKKFVQEFYDNELLSNQDKALLEDENGKFSEHKVGEYLKYVAQQANNLNTEWQPNKDGLKHTKPNIPDPIIEEANKRWVKEIESSQPKAEETVTTDVKPEGVGGVGVEPKGNTSNVVEGSGGVVGDVEINKDNTDKYVNHLKEGGTLAASDLIDLRYALREKHKAEQDALYDKVKEGKLSMGDAYVYSKNENSEGRKLGIKQRQEIDLLDKQPNSFGLEGDENANETYHFTDANSVLSVLEENHLWGEGETSGLSTTTNKAFDHPELTQVQAYGEGNKPTTFADKGIRVDLDLQKMKSDDIKIKKGNEGLGTFVGEEELRIGGRKGIEDASKYIKQIQIDRKVIDEATANEIKEAAEKRGIKVVYKTDYERPRNKLKAVEQSIKETTKAETPTQQVKVEVKEDAVEKNRQQKINDLMDDVSSFNKLPKNYQGRRTELNAIRVRADELGLKFDDTRGRLFNEKGKRVMKISADKPGSLSPDFNEQDYSPETKKHIETLSKNSDALLGLPIIGNDGRQLSTGQMETALKSVRDGKPNRAAKSLHDFIEDSVQSGEIELTDKITGQTVKIPVNEYFETFKEPVKELTDTEIEQLNFELNEDSFNFNDELYGQERLHQEIEQPPSQGAIQSQEKTGGGEKNTPTNTEAQVEKVAELETRRSEEIKEATKPDVDLPEFSEIDIEKSSSKQLKRVDRVNRDFERLKEVINCIWGKAV